MKKAFLYVNSRGYEITRHSYSGSSAFNFCARRYYLERIAGWKERKQSAAMQFGIVMESAITVMHHKQGMDWSFAKEGLAYALGFFQIQWIKHKDNAELEYSAKDGNWEDLNLSGQEMLRLYAVKYPKFDFTVPDQTCFQVQRTQEVFPGTDLAGIELISYIDIIGKQKPGRYSPDLKDDRVIWDMKVSGESCPVLVSLDPQLRTYSWITGIPTVGFLWFKKCSRELKKGVEFTFLEDAFENTKPGSFSFAAKAGITGYILSLDTNDIPISPPSVYAVLNEKTIEEFDAIKGQSKEAKAARQEFIQTRGFVIPISSITRQEIAVRIAIISDESRLDIQRQVEQDVVRIVHAAETDFWPQQGGVRFPNNKCTFCACRGICSGNDKLRDELLVRGSDESIF